MTGQTQEEVLAAEEELFVATSCQAWAERKKHFQTHFDDCLEILSAAKKANDSALQNAKQAGH
jgi:hypothetical protein